MSESESGSECDTQIGPQIVKIGDNRDQAEHVKQFYFERISTTELVRVNKLIEDMPEDGPIPRELKNIFYEFAENEPDHTDGSLILGCLDSGMLNAIFIPIIYGVQIDDLFIIRLSNKWGIFNAERSYIRTFDEPDDCQLIVKGSTFSQPDYFTCSKPGKYYIDDKVFNIQDGDDLVYKDQFLIRYDPNIISGPNYGIVYPEITVEITKARYFTFEMAGYSLEQSLTLICFDYFHYIAECVNLGEKNIFRVYAESEEYYDNIDEVTIDFNLETLIFINDVRATPIDLDNCTSNIKPGKIIKYNKQQFKNHYPQTVTKTSTVDYKDKSYVLTEFGPLYEISKGSGKHTKPALSIK